MIKLYSATVRIITLLIAITAFSQGAVIAMQRAVNDTTKSRSPKVTDTRPFRPSFASASTKSDYIPLKRVSNAVYNGLSTTKNLQSADPVNLLNVKIYPIPVADQINMSYHLAKDSNVIIEIMDVLGVKISTLLSQRKSAGEQKESFPITSKLNSGIYLIRVTAGGQQVIKRISVL